MSRLNPLRPGLPLCRWIHAFWLATRSFRPAAALGLLCWVMAPLTAWAQGSAEPPPSEQVAITRMPFAGIAAELETELQASLRATLARQGYNILPQSTVDNRLVNEPQLLACTTPLCYSRLAQFLSVRRVVEGEVQRLQLSTFVMRLQLRDLYTGRIVGTAVQERCDICANDDVRLMVVRAANILAKVAPPKPDLPLARVSTSGTLFVESDPTGAQIKVDAEARAERTPATLLLAVGVHQITVEGTDYEVLRRKVEIIPGQQVMLSLVLTPKSARRAFLRPLAWTSLIGAVGLAIGSGVLFHFHGKPVVTDECPAREVAFHCPEKWDNLGAGIATAVGAGALAVTAGLAFYFDAAGPRRRPISRSSPAVPPPPAASLTADPLPARTAP